MKIDLETQFQEAFKKASNTKERIPQDIMLQFYAYYKQATKGNTFPFDTNFGVRNAFKFNAWKQLEGMTEDEAKQAYINLVNKFFK